MYFEDEELAQLRLKETRRDFINVETGMYVEDDLITFKDEYIFENQLRIMIPTVFLDMPWEIAQMKYPYEKRPQIIKTNTEGNVNLMFDLFPEQISVEIERMVESICITLQLGNPSCRFLEDGMIDVNGNLIGWGDFSSNSLNGKIYNIFMIMNLNQKMMLARFNCPYNKKHHWKPVFSEIMNTLEKKEERNGN